MKFLITGGAGFIGSTLADRLIKDKENEVIIIDNFDSFYSREIKESNIKDNLNRENYKLYEGDICDSRFLKKVFSENQIDTVIHIAAKAGVRPSIIEPIDYVKTNIEGTVNILEQMKDFNVKKMIFTSSSSVYGNCENDKFCENLNVSKPISHYAATKSSCEQFLYVYSHLYGIQSIILRLFTVYGPKQRPDLAISKFVNLINKDEAIPVLGNGFTERSYTYIDDVIDGIISAIDYNGSLYEIINIGGNSTITLKEMIQTIENTMNKKAKKEFLPMQEGDVKRTSCDNTKAERLLNYRSKVSFKDGIQNFVKYLGFDNNG